MAISIYFTNTRQVDTRIPPFNELVSREIPSSNNPIAASVEEYFKGPSAEEQARGLVSQSNGFVGYRRLEFRDGYLAVYLAGTCRSSGTSYSIAQPLIATLKQFPSVVYVKIYDGYDHTRDPFGKDDSWPACVDAPFTLTSTPRPAPTRTARPTSTPSAAPSATRSPVATATTTNTFLPKAIAIVSSTPAPSSTPTRTPPPTATLKPSSTPSKTPAPTVEVPPPSSTSTRTPLPAATLKPSSAPSKTPAPTIKALVTSSTPTQSSLPTATLRPSSTPSKTPAPTIKVLLASPTPTQTPAPTATLRPTQTPTRTLAPTATVLPPSATSTRAPLPTATLTPSSTPSKAPLPTVKVLQASPTPTHTPAPTARLRPTQTPTRGASTISTAAHTPTPATIPITIYFTHNGIAGSQIPPANEGVVRQVPASLNPITAALDQYFIGPNAQEQTRGLIAVRNGFINYRRLVLGNGVLRVYLGGQCQTNGSSYSAAQPLIATLKTLPAVSFVKLFDEHDQTRDPLGLDDSWPTCLDVRLTPTLAPTATQTITPRPSNTPAVAPSAAPLLSRTATATRGLAANTSSTPASTLTITQRPSRTPSSAVQATPPLTATPTPSPAGGQNATPAPSVKTTRAAATPTIDPGCNRAKFISDVTVADNTILRPGESFVKTWRIQNAGTCPWSAAYQLVFTGGDKMAGPVSVSLPMSVAPDQTVDISVNLSAPPAAGQYEGLWLLQSPDGRTFGVGGSATGNLWVKITVIAPALTTPASTAALAPEATTSTPNSAVKPSSSLQVGADFAEEACAAQWRSTDGILACPGREGDPRGFVLIVDQVRLEDGTTAPLPSLLMQPSFSIGGYIFGIYPEYVVQPGDRFQTSVGCEFNVPSCSALFRFSYIDGGGTLHDLWSLHNVYDGTSFIQELDLSPLAGQRIRFVLGVTNLGSATAGALWVAPRILQFQAPLPAETETPTALLPSTSPPPSATATAQSTETALPTAFLTPAPPASPTSVPAVVKTAVPALANPPPLPTLQQILDLVVSFLRRIAGVK